MAVWLDVTDVSSVERAFADAASGGHTPLSADESSPGEETG